MVQHLTNFGFSSRLVQRLIEIGAFLSMADWIHAEMRQKRQWKKKLIGYRQRKGYPQSFAKIAAEQKCQSFPNLREERLKYV